MLTIYIYIKENFFGDIFVFISDTKYKHRKMIVAPRLFTNAGFMATASSCFKFHTGGVLCMAAAAKSDLAALR